jgi:hypothetical protein
MKQQFLSLLGILLLLMTPLAMPPAFADSQGIFGEVSAESPLAFYDLPNMEAGQSIYLYVAAEDFDSYAGICTAECEEVLARNDDASEEDLNPAIEFEFPEDGDYVIFVAACCDATTEGGFVLQVSLDDPTVLTGEGEFTTETTEIAFAAEASDEYKTPLYGGAGTQLLSTTLEDGVFGYVLPEMKAGQTIYLYLESEDFDPALAICGEGCEEYLATNDDKEDGNSASALEYEFTEDGTYFIEVSDCCEDGAEGVFYLQISLDDTAVLEGEGELTDAMIAYTFEQIENGEFKVK